jgi:hypothetical protein
MPTPFPGMDPYLEKSSLWPGVHSRLIVALADELTPQLEPKYYVAIEERTYSVAPEQLTFVSRPDVAVIQPMKPTNGQSRVLAVPSGVPTTDPVIVELPRLEEVTERYLEIRDSQDEVVTVLEILSPANKRSGEGRQQYERKRLQIFDTLTHLVEIDLLRAGEPMMMSGGQAASQTDYRILISRAELRPRAVLLPFGVRQPIPGFYLPLRPGDQEPVVDLNRIFHALYDRGGYARRIDYRAEAEPPITGADAVWADGQLRAAGLR